MLHIPEKAVELIKTKPQAGHVAIAYALYKVIVQDCLLLYSYGYIDYHV